MMTVSPSVTHLEPERPKGLIWWPQGLNVAKFGRCKHPLQMRTVLTVRIHLPCRDTQKQISASFRRLIRLSISSESSGAEEENPLTRRE